VAYAPLTYRDSLRDIEACLRIQAAKLYHMGFRSTVAHNTSANANAIHDRRISADFAQSLISIARKLYAEVSFGVRYKAIDKIQSITTTAVQDDLLMKGEGTTRQSMSGVLG